MQEKQRKILKHPEMIALLREREEIRSAIYAKYDVQENKYDDAKDPGYRARRDKAGDESHKYDINTGWSKEEQLAKKLTNTPYATLSGDVVSKYIQPRLQKMPGYAEFQSEYRKIQQFNPDGPDKFTTNEPYSITDGRVHFLTVKSLHRWAGNPVRRALINSYIK